MYNPANPPEISETELANIGSGHIAYLRQITGKEISEAFPNAMQIPPEAKVWALFGADGTPLALADDQGSAISSAFDNNLVPVAVH
ncbi:MAG: DUF1150 domain-containing protein [Pseudomonadota bacterium]